MNEREWLTCADPEPMLKWWRGQVSERRLRLFACACARQVWHLLEDDPARRAVALAEQLADGLVPVRETPALRPLRAPAGVREDSAKAAARCAAAQACARTPDAERAAMNAAAAVQFAAPHGQRKAAWQAARQRQCELIRDLSPGPASVAAVDRSWLSWNGGLVTKLAHDLREGQRFAEVPVLGDALEEAGCTDEVILAHCRGPLHVRGCWLMDLLLDRL
jgi:hypothetical protein